MLISTLLSLSLLPALGGPSHRDGFPMQVVRFPSPASGIPNLPVIADDEVTAEPLVVLAQRAIAGSIGLWANNRGHTYELF